MAARIRSKIILLCLLVCTLSAYRIVKTPHRESGEALELGGLDGGRAYDFKLFAAPDSVPDPNRAQQVRCGGAGGI
jgi:hypothetical protein